MPKGLDYALWQGPAPHRPFRSNYLHYNWHWFWHWGNGELGNNGVHYVDICRWGLGVDYPTRVVSSGGRYRYDDDPPQGKPRTLKRSLPCIKETNLGGATCEQCTYPTPEEVAAEEAEVAGRLERIGKARAAIVEHLGPWKRGTPAAGGKITCPNCGAAAALAFSRAGVNGHIHARCATPKCCSWME